MVKGERKAAPGMEVHQRGEAVSQQSEGYTYHYGASDKTAPGPPDARPEPGQPTSYW